MLERHSTPMRAASLVFASFALVYGCAATTADDAETTTAAATESDKRIEVSLQDQRARAFEGDRCVREFPVSTGKVYEGGNFDTTLHGGRRIYDFPILSKAKVVRMRSPFPNVSYDQDVYNAIKLTDWGIYLHEADWTRTGPGESQVTSGDCGHCGNTSYAPYGLSHGCINERHDDAVWLYDWVPPANPTKKVVHLTLEHFAPETCDVATGAATSPPSDDPDRVAGITYAECLAHPTHCLEDLRDASGAFTGAWICWRSGARSSSGAKVCDEGTWR